MVRRQPAWSLLAPPAAVGSFGSLLILRVEEGSDRSQTVDADDWIDHWSAGQYEIREQAGEVVLSLLWWKDSTMVERFGH